MKIVVKAKPRSRESKVELVTQPSLALGLEKAPDIYKVSVKEPPENGKANDAIIVALAEYFDIPRSSVQLVLGQSSRKKIFEIEN
jgi:uncharacterized protein